MIVRKIAMWMLASLSISSAYQCNMRSNTSRQSLNHLCFKAAPSNISPIYLSASEKETTRPTQIIIENLLDSGSIDEAISELRHQQGTGADVTSSLHAVIEACCAGGGDNRRYKNQKKQSSGSDRLKLAYSLLQSMESPTSHAYDILISGYARRGRWHDASKLLTEMEGKFCSNDGSKGMGIKKENSDIVPSLHTYHTVLTSLANSGQYDKMMSLLTKMRRRGVKPNVYTFNTLMNICAQDKPARWKEALSLLSQCQREPGVTPDLVTYTTAMRACARARKSNKAMEIFRVIKDMGLELDVYCYTTAMNACANDRAWKTALKLMDEMIEKGISPNEFTYSVAITACGNGGQWTKALELLDKMRSMGMKINTITYNSAISALAKAARAESKQQRRFDYDQTSATEAPSDADPGALWRRALDLIENMESDGVPLDKFTYSSAINCCGAAGRWEEAVGLIRAMKEDGNRENKPNKVTFTSAIVACGISGQWDAAFDLFNEMKHDGIQPDLVSYNALVAAGMNGNKPDEVFDLWTEMCKTNKGNISPDIVTLTEVIATLDRAAGKANRHKVDRVFTEAVERGIILREDSLDGAWDIDLSGMSFPVARAACRFIFERLTNRVRDGNEKVEDLSLITGASRMREYVREVLRDELKPSVYCVVPKMEQGTLQVKAKMVENYINAQRNA